MANKTRERIAVLDWLYQGRRAIEAGIPSIFEEYRKMVWHARNNANSSLEVSWPMDTVFAPRQAIETMFLKSFSVTQTEATKRLLFLASSFVESFVAWEVTKGIYSFDCDLLEQLVRSEFKNTIPSHFLHTPEYCILVHFPYPITIHPEWEPLIGLMVKPAYGNCEKLGLSILAIEKDNAEQHTFHIPDILSYDSVPALINSVIERNIFNNLSDQNKEFAIGLIQLSINVLLYLNSEKPDINRPLPTFLPQVHPGKKHIKIPHQEQIYEVGYRIGAKIRAARAKEDADWEASGETSKTRVTHIRRAHWHTYWTGSRKNNEMKPILKWLNPILVGDEELIPALHS